MRQKGLKNECELSLSFHREGIPLLISPQLLRKRDMGQVDLARLRKHEGNWLLELREVKSSDMGTQQMLRHQRSRLFATQRFLAGVFGSRSRLLTLMKDIYF